MNEAARLVTMGDLGQGVSPLRYRVRERRAHESLANQISWRLYAVGWEEKNPEEGISELNEHAKYNFP